MSEPAAQLNYSCAPSPNFLVFKRRNSRTMNCLFFHLPHRKNKRNKRLRAFVQFFKQQLAVPESTRRVNTGGAFARGWQAGIQAGGRGEEIERKGRIWSVLVSHIHIFFFHASSLLSQFLTSFAMFLSPA